MHKAYFLGVKSMMAKYWLPGFFVSTFYSCVSAQSTIDLHNYKVKVHAKLVLSNGDPIMELMCRSRVQAINLC